MPLVSVVVVSHQSRGQLPDCLASVLQERDVGAELIVVDNASTDGGPDLVRDRFPQARIMVNERNLGFASAVNRGLGVARGEFVLLLNPDVVLLPGALGRLLEFLEGHPEAACAAPRQWVDADGFWQFSAIPWPPHWAIILASLPGLWRVGIRPPTLVRRWELNRAVWRAEAPQAVPFVSGACMLLRRSSLQAIQGMDGHYFLFFEDVDLCARLRQAGSALYIVPESGAIHRAGASIRSLPGDVVERHLSESGRRYLERHGDPFTLILWDLLQGRRVKRAAGHRRRSLPRGAEEKGSEVTLSWPALPWAVSYWVEVARDPIFLYAAAAGPERPECRLSEGLSRMAHGGRLFWRVAGVNGQGQTGRFGTHVSSRRQHNLGK